MCTGFNTYESSTVSADDQREFALPVVLRWCEYTAWIEVRARWVCLYLVWLSGWGEPRRAANVQGCVDDCSDARILQVFQVPHCSDILENDLSICIQRDEDEAIFYVCSCCQVG